MYIFWKMCCFNYDATLKFEHFENFITSLHHFFLFSVKLVLKIVHFNLKKAIFD